MEKTIDPYDAIFVPEGVDGTHIQEIDAHLKSGKVDGWLQIVVLKEGQDIHIFPQGYGIPETLSREAARQALDWIYAPEA